MGGGYQSQVNLTNLANNIIYDNTQSFFKKPIINKNIYNAYSPRKFFGVPDGAYLITSNNNKVYEEYDIDVSYERSLFLLKSLELGTNNAYKDNLNNEDNIGLDIKTMSKLTSSILSSIDYDYVIKKRRDNFQYLHSKLKGINELNLDLNDDVPTKYPLLIKNDKLRETLIKNHIYVPCWWKHCLEEVKQDTLEYKLSKYLLPLPIDQRYEKKDMDEMIKIIITNTI